LAVDVEEAVEGLEEVKREKWEVHKLMALWTGQDVGKEARTEARAVC
jgi:hypothetical protein